MELKNEEYYSQKISEYLDGELDSLETGELFKEISNNPSLQEELKEQINLRSLFQQELLPPPKDSRFVLLGKLNLQRSAAIIGLIATFFSEIKKIIFNPAFGAAVFGVALFIFGYFFNQNAKENETNGNKIEKQTLTKNINTEEKNTANDDFIKQNPAQNKFNSNLIAGKNEVSTKKDNNLKQNKPLIISKLKSPKNLTETANSQVVDNFIDNNDYQNLTLNNTSELVQNQQQIKQVAFEFREIPFTNFVKDLFMLNLFYDYSKKSDVNYFDFSFLDKMSLSIIKSANYSNIKTDLEPLTNPLLNNYSLALAYNIDKNNSFSIEYGQENYPQKFSGYVNGISANINQVYTAQWYGLAYQYTFDLPADNLLINPYIKILGSATKIGPLFKSSAGIAYHLNDKLLITAGLEGSILMYQFQNKSYNTPKYGFFYGSRINF